MFLTDKRGKKKGFPFLGSKKRGGGHVLETNSTIMPKRLERKDVSKKIPFKKRLFKMRSIVRRTKTSLRGSSKLGKNLVIRSTRLPFPLTACSRRITIEIN